MDPNSKQTGALVEGEWLHVGLLTSAPKPFIAQLAGPAGRVLLAKRKLDLQRRADPRDPFHGQVLRPVEGAAQLPDVHAYHARQVGPCHVGVAERPALCKLCVACAGGERLSFFQPPGRGKIGIRAKCHHRKGKSVIRCPEGGFSAAAYVWRTRETAMSERVFLSGRNHEPPA